jgi:hypothetical protein
LLKHIFGKSLQIKFLPKKKKKDLKAIFFKYNPIQALWLYIRVKRKVQIIAIWWGHSNKK